MDVQPRIPERAEQDHWEARVDLAAAFRWTARLNMHEAVANHFSLAVNREGTRFLINPNQMHFARIRASDLLELDTNDPDVLSGPGAPDATAWGLHAPLHHRCRYARCVMHLHSAFATVLASLEDSTLPPIDLNTATFFDRMIVDRAPSGLAFEAEGERCAAMLTDPRVKIMVMGNHGVLAIGDGVADTLTRIPRVCAGISRAIRTRPMVRTDKRPASRRRPWRAGEMPKAANWSQLTACDEIFFGRCSHGRMCPGTLDLFDRRHCRSGAGADGKWHPGTH